MASAAPRLDEGGGSRAVWLGPLLLALLALLAIGSSWIEPAAAPFASRLSDTAEALVAEGGLLAWPLAGVCVAFWAVIVVLLQPAALLLALVAVETAAGRKAPRGHWRLAWAARVTIFLLIYAAGLAVARSGLRMPEPLFDLGSQGPALTVSALLLWLLVVDFFQYWMHRAFHRFAWLWRFHAVHHSPDDLGVLYNLAHPLEAASSFLLKIAPVGLIVRVDLGELVFLLALVTLHTHFVHMSVPVHFGRMRLLVADNVYHFLHHSRDPADYDCNFAAMFPLLDLLFGTYRAPDGGRLAETGLTDHLPPGTLADYLLARLPKK